jgi:hypothetical protein
MAVTKRNANTQTFDPNWPQALSADRVRFTYDRPTDTLFVDFYGEALPAASIPLDRGDRDYLFLRIEPETAVVVGLQVEHFLSYAVHRHPELVAALNFATLVGIDRNELRQITPFEPAPTTEEDATALVEDIFRLSA